MRLVFVLLLAALASGAFIRRGKLKQRASVSYRAVVVVEDESSEVTSVAWTWTEYSAATPTDLTPELLLVDRTPPFSTFVVDVVFEGDVGASATFNAKAEMRNGDVVVGALEELPDLVVMVDADNDGVYDEDECGGPCSDVDTDTDGVPDFQDVDSDGDGLEDGVECPVWPCRDTDADGVPDFLDADDDGDGVDTVVECPSPEECPDTDNDGTADYLDSDSDGDGISDEEECPTQPCRDSDADGAPDRLDTDDDGDGVDTVYECSSSLKSWVETPVADSGSSLPPPTPKSLRRGGLEPSSTGGGKAVCVDTDGDGTLDYLDADDDGDGVSTATECTIAAKSGELLRACWDADNDGVADYLDNDDDNDGIPTALECPDGEPCPDTDGDGVANHLSTDADGDGLPDSLECPGGTACPDDDGDGIADVIDAVFTSGAEGCPSLRPIVRQDIYPANWLQPGTGGFTGLPTSYPMLSAAEHFGRSVAAIGDVNGDGVPDIAVGSRFDNIPYSDAFFKSTRGSVFILYMKVDGTMDSFSEISSSDGNLGVVMVQYANFGCAIAGLGDMDGDGVPDIAVGARRDHDGGHGRGAVFILFLTSSGSVKAKTKISDTSGGFTGVLDNHAWFGSALATLGDLNGDGVVDIAVGAGGNYDIGNGPVVGGNLWVLLMNVDGTVNSTKKIDRNDMGIGHLPAGVVSDGNGFALAGPGDIDGDGIPDMVVGVPLSDYGTGSYPDIGAVMVLFLDGSGSVRSYSELSASAGGFQNLLAFGDHFGTDVTAIGDYDGDGIPDVAIAAGGGQAVYFAYLTSSGTLKDHRKVSVPSIYQFSSIPHPYGLETSSIAATDFNNDGIMDMVLGFPRGMQYQWMGGTAFGTIQTWQMECECPPGYTFNITSLTCIEPPCCISNYGPVVFDCPSLVQLGVERCNSVWNGQACMWNTWHDHCFAAVPADECHLVTCPPCEDNEVPNIYSPECCDCMSSATVSPGLDGDYTAAGVGDFSVDVLRVQDTDGLSVANTLSALVRGEAGSTAFPPTLSARLSDDTTYELHPAGGVVHTFMGPVPFILAPEGEDGEDETVEVLMQLRGGHGASAPLTVSSAVLVRATMSDRGDDDDDGGVSYHGNLGGGATIVVELQAHTDHRGSATYDRNRRMRGPSTRPRDQLDAAQRHHRDRRAGEVPTHDDMGFARVEVSLGYQLAGATIEWVDITHGGSAPRELLNVGAHRAYRLPLARFEGSCYDSLRNGGEQGIDCGGPYCPPCPDLSTFGMAVLSTLEGNPTWQDVEVAHGVGECLFDQECPSWRCVAGRCEDTTIVCGDVLPSQQPTLVVGTRCNSHKSYTLSLAVSDPKASVTGVDVVATTTDASLTTGIRRKLGGLSALRLLGHARDSTLPGGLAHAGRVLVDFHQRVREGSTSSVLVLRAGGEEVTIKLPKDASDITPKTKGLGGRMGLPIHRINLVLGITYPEIVVTVSADASDALASELLHDALTNGLKGTFGDTALSMSPVSVTRAYEVDIPEYIAASVLSGTTTLSLVPRGADGACPSVQLHIGEVEEETCEADSSRLTNVGSSLMGSDTDEQAPDDDGAVKLKKTEAAGMAAVFFVVALLIVVVAVVVVGRWRARDRVEGHVVQECDPTEVAWPATMDVEAEPVRRASISSRVSASISNMRTPGEKYDEFAEVLESVSDA